MARRKWTDSSVAGLKFGPKRRPIPDPEVPGHYIRGRDGGPKSYYASARNPQGKQIWARIGSATDYSLEDARERARMFRVAIRDGKAAVGPKTFSEVAAEWFQRHVLGKKLRSASHIRNVLDNHVLPAWRDRGFEGIRRNDVAKLMDDVEDRSGKNSADRVLKIIGGIFNWYQARHEGYTTPIVRGMLRSGGKESARKRILNDEELRAVWKTAEDNGSFGAFVRLCLLTGQRRDKVAKMKWAELADGTWNIPSEAREKGNAGELVLPQVAVDIISSQPHLVGNQHVFPGRGAKAMCGFDARKKAFDAKLPDMPNWTLHDLRRTCRSLMSRAGVNDRHAERVLGHVIEGVEGVYDRHAYRDEKAHALRALAGLIDNIVNPPADNVLSLPARAL
jgi:integrase